MDEDTGLAERFERQRPRLRAMAYRMLGSLSEADDAVQNAWLRAAAADTGDVANLAAWLTTVVTRTCLNTLRTRRRRREEPWDHRVPDPVVAPAAGGDPEYQAVVSDSVGLALMVVLDELNPLERVAFVLHDLFSVPYETVAGIVARSPDATRQLASRARRRVDGRAPRPDNDLQTQRDVVDAFFAASRDGDFEALMALLAPDVVLRSDGGDARPRLNLLLRGPREVTAQASLTRTLAPFVRPALINGTAGVVVVAQGRPLSVMAFTVVSGRITTIDVLADPDRLTALGVARVAE
ncbi:RNA polymerase sigma-70 factor (ECF subfamily) [Stackebrandtia albiflava]|uniref:RNA polymerase sigma-70 factor (ECF subfamily) n=1 Tax=Stackebrandtia albiflava TaxID=406432 RepID=A0A562VDG2_9ACTN|nr:sigma-70 family RNA polymerase sigma factor [Stackebrandtia albiflava]TWJ15923.1 RNA polymerase sigma-70 factor (ECF subfamily) [Stackebrandtia albiflava]